MNTLTTKHFLIGLLVLISFISLTYVSLVFYAKQERRDGTPYLIHFPETAGGLAPGSPVKFKGITIGAVDSLSISQKHNDRIEVLIKIKPPFVVKQGMHAILEVAGITGESLISITGTTPDSAPLQKEETAPYPLIPVQKSSLQKLMNSAPEVLSGAKELIDRVSSLFTPENKEQFDNLLKNINKIFDSVQENQQNIEEIVNNILLFTRGINAVAQKVNDTLTHIDESSHSFQLLTKNTNTLVKTANTFVNDIKPGLQNFSEYGFNDLTYSLAHLSNTLASIDEFVKHLDGKLASIFPQNQSATYEFPHAS